MMFEHLSDPHPPEPDAGARALVSRRAQRINRRTQATRVLVLTAVMVVLAGAVMATRHRGGNEQIDTVATNPTCCGSITGTVRTLAGPAGGATVQLMLTSPKAAATAADAAADSAPNTWLIKGKPAMTDRAGMYRFDDLEAGDYLLRISKFVADQPSFIGDGSTTVVPIASRAKVIHLSARETLVEDWTLVTSPNSKIRGHVTDAATRFPVTGVRVRLYIGGELTRAALTNDIGEYDLGGVPVTTTFTLAFVDENEARQRAYATFATQWFNGGDHAASFTVAASGLVADAQLVRNK